MITISRRSRILLLSFIRRHSTFHLFIHWKDLLPLLGNLSGKYPKYDCFPTTCRSEWDVAGEKLSRVEEKQFGDVITEKDGVEQQIRRAQKAVLNPSKNCIHLM